MKGLEQIKADEDALARRRRAKPRPVGRPPRAKKPAEVRFEIRLTGKERDRWQAAADRQGVALAELVRESVETRIARGSSR